jgi:hypothetical protein
VEIRLVDLDEAAPNLRCVIGYNDDDPAFNEDSVDEMAGIAKLILYDCPAGIDVDFDIVPISTSPPSWIFSNIHETRKLLRDLQHQGNKEYPSRGRGSGALHVAVGGQDWDAGVLGRAITFTDLAEPGVDSTYRIVAEHMASSGFEGRTDMTNECLDSCGVFVYTANPYFQHQGGDLIWGTTLAGIVLAHEIGHAIGLQHYNSGDNYGVMSTELSKAMPFSRYDHFNTPVLLEREQHALINLRMLLGRETTITQKFPVFKGQ